MDILQKIVEKKREEVALLKGIGVKGPSGLAMNSTDGPRGFRTAVARNNPMDRIRVIAEVKKASPSKGLICPNFNPVEIARDYQEAGASAISVLTDREFFQGSLEYLLQVRNTVNLPLLRKDFIIDPIQIDEAILWGADAVLLIVAILDDHLLKELLSHAVSQGLDCLVEVHDRQEAVRALEAGAKLIGINNRNLRDFTVSLENTVQVRQIIPSEIPVVSESGIGSQNDVEYLKGHNISAVLVGESLVRADDRRAKLQEFLV